MSDSHRKPDFILYAVVEGKNGDKGQWIRFAAAWKASKGYSLKVEDAFRLFAPFNNARVGLALMPFEDRQRTNNDDDDNYDGGSQHRNRGRR